LKKIVRNKYFWFVLTALFIIGLFVGEDEEQTKEPLQEVSTIVKEEPKPQKKEVEKEEKKETPTTITLNEFNQTFKQDQNENQYPNGQFQLKDGSNVQADYLMYRENELFEFASAVFYEGKLVNLSVETDKTWEEIEEGIGISFKTASVTPTLAGWNINFMLKFYKDNIAKYPNEWE
jgi:hypothetical protein